MTDLLNRVLTILENGLPDRFVAPVVALLIGLLALAVIFYFGRPGFARVGAPDLYAAYKTTINVNVANNTVGSGNSVPKVPRPAPKAPRPAADCYAELRRIAALSGDDDEELHIS